MTFEEMWEDADFTDAAAGGVDSIPENEYEDYVQACLSNQFRKESEK